MLPCEGVRAGVAVGGAQMGDDVGGAGLAPYFLALEGECAGGRAAAHGTPLRETVGWLRADPFHLNQGDDLPGRHVPAGQVCILRALAQYFTARNRL